jgi:hypothetical protein
MKISEKFISICNLGITEPCLCKFCSLVDPNNNIYGYHRIKGTKIFTSIMWLGDGNSVCFYENSCPFSQECIKVSFEEVFERLPDTTKDIIIFNINLFR